MRLICPNCHKSITAPDADAGKTTKCPECGHEFAAPELNVATPPAEPPPAPPPPPPPPPASPSPSTYSVETPAPAPEPPRPAFGDDLAMKPPAAAEQPKAPPPADAPPTLPRSEGDWTAPAGTRFHSFGVSARAVHWLPAVCLTLALLLSFFRWVAAEPAGYKAYAQSPWQALFAGFSSNPVAERRVFQKAADISQRLSPSLWMLPYFLTLLPAVALAWAMQFLMPERVPARLQGVWRLRARIFTALAVASLLFLLIQLMVGFGLERAVSRMAEEDYAAKATAAGLARSPQEAATPEEEAVAEMGIDRELGQYHLGGTLWLDLAVLAHFLAVAGLVLEYWLIRRGTRPVPRVGVTY